MNELEDLRVRMRAEGDRVVELISLLAKERVTVDRLRKENATCCLQLLATAFTGTVEEGLAELEKGKTDPEVLELVRAFGAFPIGDCTNCGRPAPIREETVLGYAVCAWGCPG